MAGMRLHHGSDDHDSASHVRAKETCLASSATWMRAMWAEVGCTRSSDMVARLLTSSSSSAARMPMYPPACDAVLFMNRPASRSARGGRYDGVPARRMYSPNMAE